MTVHLTVRALPHQGGVDAQASAPPTYAGRVAGAYERAFADYESRLRSEGQRLGPLGLASELTGYPSVDAVLYEEEGEQAIALDFGLLELLVESFVMDGWVGIERLQQAVNAHASDDEVRQSGQSPSGGIPDDAGKVWVIARGFFETTRNLVGMLVHEALVALELKAAEVVASRLESGLAAIATARAGSLRQSEWSRQGGYFELQDRQLARALYKDMTKLVYELAQLKRLAQERDEVRRNAASPAFAGASGAQGGTGRTDPDKAAENLEKAEADLAHAEQAVASARDIVHRASPLALLALARIEEGFSVAQMEQAIDAGLREREESCRRLRQAISTAESRVAARWPRPTLDEAVSAAQMQAIAQWTIPYGGHTSAAAAHVLGAIGGDAGWLPLAREDILHELASSEAIAVDSFEYPVYFHFVSAWMAAFEKEVELQEQVTGVLSGVSRVVALASLLAFKSPAIASFVESRVVARLLLGMAAYTFFKGYSALEEAIQAELMGSGHLSAREIATSAALEKEQDAFVKDFAKGLLLDAVLGRVSQRFTPVRRLILARNYYEDARTLLSAPADG